MPNPTGNLEDPRSYYNRWLPLLFENVVDEDNQDGSLENKICSVDEMSGILNWALKGLKRLKKNGKFTNTKDWTIVMKMMKSHGDSVNSFEHDCIVEDRDAFYTKDEMFDVYLEYCKLNEKTPEKDKNIFGKYFNSERAKHYNGNGKTGWKGGRVEMKIFGF
jgi:putative DNA primase/helicase